MGWGVTPPYLDDVWSGIDEWPVRVSLLDLLLFFRSWHLVPLSEEAIGWFQCGYLNLFFWPVLKKLASPTLSSDGEGPYTYVLWRVSPVNALLVDTRSHCQQHVAFVIFTTLFGEGVCMCAPFVCYLLVQSSSFGRRWMDRRMKKTGLVFDILLFF
jgi:hypothetical protein